MNSSVETPVYAVVQTAKVEFASPPAFPVWKPIFAHPKLSPAENLLLLSPKLGTGGIVTNGAGFCPFSLLPFPHLLASASSHSLLPPPIVFHFPYLGEGRNMYSGEDIRTMEARVG